MRQDNQVGALNKKVFSFFLKLGRLMLGSRRPAGRLFHVAGEETANARGPIVTVQVRGTRSNQCRIYIPCSLSLRLLGPFGVLWVHMAWHKNCVKKMMSTNKTLPVSPPRVLRFPGTSLYAFVVEAKHPLTTWSKPEQPHLLPETCFPAIAPRRQTVTQIQSSAWNQQHFEEISVFK